MRPSSYDNEDVVTELSKDIITIGDEPIAWSDVGAGANKTALGLDSVTISDDWVDEKNPPVKVGYDAVNQRLSFEVDRTVLVLVRTVTSVPFRFTGRPARRASTTLV